MKRTDKATENYTMKTAKELQECVSVMPDNYFLIDARRDKESFYALTEKDLVEYPYCICGVCVNYIMEGKLKEAWDLINGLPENSLVTLGLVLVHPEITFKRFMKIVGYLKDNNIEMQGVILTASRPYLLNGFNDFSRIGPLLEEKKEEFLEYGGVLYGKYCINFIYKLCLAEYKYQQSDLIEAEVLVNQAIKEFDKKIEQRLLFAALYLQSKILLTQGRTVNAESYIKNIRTFVKKVGVSEFAFNINAAEVLCALYDGNFPLIARWLKNDAPDEFSDFNMLDLYRYMIKMRCYIVMKKYPAVLALAEKLRPLLEAGGRHMDLCEIDLLEAMSLYYAGEKDLAFESMGRALKIAKRRKYYRLIADEGEVMLNVLIDYLKTRPTDPVIKKIVELTRNMAINQPLYLKVQNQSSEVFSQMEIDILKLLEHGKTKEEIGEYFFITVNTVKYHMKSIYSKLNASSPHQAVWNAKVMGII